MKRKIILMLLSTSCFSATASESDSIPSGFSRRLQWQIGGKLAGAFVPGTNGFLKGDNYEDLNINSNFSGGVRVDFCFDKSTREGMLYDGLYQGIGVDVNTFFAPNLLGTPVSVYIYQGAPILRFNSRLWLGYEWQFGAAFGWEHTNDDIKNTVVSTNVTAHMGIGFKLHYRLSNRCKLALGAEGRHFSNGNTSWPNGGVNSIGASIDVAYTLNPQEQSAAPLPSGLSDEADHSQWFYDIMAYGAWRRHFVKVDDSWDMQLCPGKMGVVGLQFSPMRKLNRWVAIGPSLDLQWDESAGLPPYWVEGTTGDNIKFYRPPFGKQISAGLSAHAELTMPIFSINTGLGYDFVNPNGNKRFYQSLTLKTFITRHLFLNVGYRIGDFSIPQNLMLGAGVRL